MAGRQAMIDSILEGLDNGPGDPNRASLLVGARGVGKTALLTAIAEAWWGSMSRCWLTT
ncbi:MAG: ATP-binding protein [Bifidobacteriaceae bacterium]|jgi:DNA replication protein DnaC|nr:ATP-binding protein [Bifidobacteriaceae bacterium]